LEALGIELRPSGVLGRHSMHGPHTQTLASILRSMMTIGKLLPFYIIHPIKQLSFIHPKITGLGRKWKHPRQLM
jgi:hypothetical protein